MEVDRLHRFYAAQQAVLPTQQIQKHVRSQDDKRFCIGAKSHRRGNRALIASPDRMRSQELHCFERLTMLGGIGNGFTPKVIWSILKDGAAGGGFSGLAPHDLRASLPSSRRRARADPVPAWARLDRSYGEVSGRQTALPKRCERGNRLGSGQSMRPDYYKHANLRGPAVSAFKICCQ